MQARPIALMEGVKHNSIGARAVGWIFNGADPVRRNRAFSVIANRRDDVEAHRRIEAKSVSSP